jgi:hypothetical protein
MNRFLWLLGLLSIVSCSSDSGGEGLREVPVGPNAAIIRNPVQADQPTDSSEAARLTFEQTVFDFGEVEEGTIVAHTFSFVNTGTVPLLISDARSTCGCTVPEWPREAISPGEEGVINVRFDTGQKMNQQSKPITITANTLPAQTRIYLRGFVRSAE